MKKDYLEFLCIIHDFGKTIYKLNFKERYH